VLLVAGLLSSRQPDTVWREEPAAAAAALCSNYNTRPSIWPAKSARRTPLCLARGSQLAGGLLAPRMPPHNSQPSGLTDTKRAHCWPWQAGELVWQASWQARGRASLPSLLASSLESGDDLASGEAKVSAGVASRASLARLGYLESPLAHRLAPFSFSLSPVPPPPPPPPGWRARACHSPFAILARPTPNRQAGLFGFPLD